MSDIEWRRGNTRNIPIKKFKPPIKVTELFRGEK
jgi:hypothetical protein